MEVTVITFVGWVSRQKLGDLTLSRAPGRLRAPTPTLTRALRSVTVVAHRPTLSPAHRRPPASAL
jgi:hypothetical protein